jgi:hypothetical protein
LQVLKKFGLFFRLLLENIEENCKKKTNIFYHRDAFSLNFSLYTHTHTHTVCVTMSRTSSTSTRRHLLVFLILIGNFLVLIKCFPSSDAGALSPSMFSNENSKQDKANNQKIGNNEKANSGGAKDTAPNALSPDEANTISVIMTTLMPSMFNLFRNITPDEFKANFKEPCRFDALLDIFKQMPPLFDKIATKYPNKPDLVAYYSMQLASTFLVNNGSLTMACLYNMLSLQTRLMTFSLDIMDNPEGNPALVGKYIYIYLYVSRNSGG